MKKKAHFFLFSFLITGCNLIVFRPPVPASPLLLLGEVYHRSAAFVWKEIEYAETYVMYFRSDADWVSINFIIDTADSGWHRGILPELLEPNTTYYFILTAVNSKGEESAASEEIFLRTLLQTPVIRHIEALDDHTILLEFDPVPGADAYAIFCSAAEGVLGRQIIETRETFITLEISENYSLFYRVQAISETNKNDSRPSMPKSAITKLMTPQFKFNDGGVIENDENTANTVTLHWDEVRLADSYEILYHTVEDAPENLAASVKTNATSVTITRLEDNTFYYFKIRALNSSGNQSLFSDTVTSTTRIRKPSLFKVKTKTSTIILLEWEDSGAGVDYFLDFSATQSMNDAVSFGPLRITQFLLTDLVETTQYFFRLSARGQSGKLSEYAFLDCVTLFSPDLNIVFDDPHPSDPVLTGNPGTISQVNKESFTITAQTTGWDKNSYEWYLNGERQNVTGNSFVVDYRLAMGPYVLTFLATKTGIPIPYSTSIYFKVIN